MPTNMWPFMAHKTVAQDPPRAPTAARGPGADADPGPSGADEAAAPPSPPSTGDPASNATHGQADLPAAGLDPHQCTAAASHSPAAGETSDTTCSGSSRSSSGSSTTGGQQQAEQVGDECVVNIAPVCAGVTDAPSSPPAKKEPPSSDHAPRGAAAAVLLSSNGSGLPSDGRGVAVTRSLRTRGDTSQAQPKAQPSQQLPPHPSVLQRARSRGAAGTVAGAGAGAWDNDGCVFVENALLDSYCWHGIKKLYAYGIFFLVIFLAVWFQTETGATAFKSSVIASFASYDTGNAWESSALHGVGSTSDAFEYMIKYLDNALRSSGEVAPEAGSFLYLGDFAHVTYAQLEIKFANSCPSADAKSRVRESMQKLRSSLTPLLDDRTLERYTEGGAAGPGGVSDLPAAVPLLQQGAQRQQLLPTSQLTSGILDLTDNCVDLSPRTLSVDPADGPEDPLTDNIRNVLFNKRYGRELSEFEVDYYSFLDLVGRLKRQEVGAGGGAARLYDYYEEDSAVVAVPPDSRKCATGYVRRCTPIPDQGGGQQQQQPQQQQPQQPGATGRACFCAHPDTGLPRTLRAYMQEDAVRGYSGGVAAVEAPHAFRREAKNRAVVELVRLWPDFAGKVSLQEMQESLAYLLGCCRGVVGKYATQLRLGLHAHDRRNNDSNVVFYMEATRDSNRGRLETRTLSLTYNLSWRGTGNFFMVLVIFGTIADIVGTVHAVLLARQQGRGLWAYIASGSRHPFTWHGLDVLHQAAMFAWVCIWLHLQAVTRAALASYPQSAKELASLSSSAQLFTAWLYMGLAMFLVAGLRSLRYLKHHDGLRIFYTLFRLAYYDILEFATFMIGIAVLLATAIFGIFIISGGNSVFTVFGAGLSALTRLSFGFLDYDTFVNDGNGLGSYGAAVEVFFWVSVVLLVLVVQNTLLAIFTRAYETAKQGAAANGAQDSIFLLHALYDFCFLCTYRARNFLLAAVWALLTDPLGVTCYDDDEEAVPREEEGPPAAQPPLGKGSAGTGAGGAAGGASGAQGPQGSGGSSSGSSGSSGARAQRPWVFWSLAYALQNGASSSEVAGLGADGPSLGAEPSSGGVGAGASTSASTSASNKPELQRAKTLRISDKQEQPRRLGSLSRLLRPQVTTHRGRTAAGAGTHPTAAAPGATVGAGLASPASGAGPTLASQPSSPPPTPVATTSGASQQPSQQPSQHPSQQPQPQQPQQPQPGGTPPPLAATTTSRSWCLPSSPAAAAAWARVAARRVWRYGRDLPYRLALYWAEAHLRDFELLAAGDARKAAAPSRFVQRQRQKLLILSKGSTLRDPTRTFSFTMARWRLASSPHMAALVAFFDDQAMSRLNVLPVHAVEEARSEAHAAAAADRKAEVAVVAAAAVAAGAAAAAAHAPAGAAAGGGDGGAGPAGSGGSGSGSPAGGGASSWGSGGSGGALPSDGSNKSMRPAPVLAVLVEEPDEADGSAAGAGSDDSGSGPAAAPHATDFKHQATPFATVHPPAATLQAMETAAGRGPRTSSGGGAAGEGAAGAAGSTEPQGQQQQGQQQGKQQPGPIPEQEPEEDADPADLEDAEAVYSMWRLRAVAVAPGGGAGAGKVSGGVSGRVSGSGGGGSGSLWPMGSGSAGSAAGGARAQWGPVRLLPQLQMLTPRPKRASARTSAPAVVTATPVAALPAPQAPSKGTALPESDAVLEGAEAPTTEDPVPAVLLDAVELKFYVEAFEDEVMRLLVEGPCRAASSLQARAARAWQRCRDYRAQHFGRTGAAAAPASSAVVPASSGAGVGGGVPPLAGGNAGGGPPPGPPPPGPAQQQQPAATRQGGWARLAGWWERSWCGRAATLAGLWCAAALMSTRPNPFWPFLEASLDGQDEDLKKLVRALVAVYGPMAPRISERQQRELADLRGSRAQVSSIRKLLQQGRPHGGQQQQPLGQAGRSGVRGREASSADPRASLALRASVKPEASFHAGVPLPSPAAGPSQPQGQAAGQQQQGLTPHGEHAAESPGLGGLKGKGEVAVDVEQLLRGAMERALAAALAAGSGAAAGSAGGGGDGAAAGAAAGGQQGGR